MFSPLNRECDPPHHHSSAHLVHLPCLRPHDDDDVGEGGRLESHRRPHPPDSPRQPRLSLSVSRISLGVRCHHLGGSSSRRHVMKEVYHYHAAAAAVATAAIVD